MKHGRKPTVAQRVRLKALLPNPENWLIVKDCPSCFQVEHRISGKTRMLEIRKEQQCRN